MAAASFVDKLSRWLMVIVGIFALGAIPNYIIDALALEPDGRSPEEFRWLQIKVWVAVCSGVIAWVFLFVATWFLGKRRDWARYVTVMLLASVGIGAALSGALFVLRGLGVVESKDTTTLPLVGVGFGGLALAYLCWRLISRLRSAEVLKEFREPREPASAPPK